jgi:bifunctional DNA-binding transcriptional regulator/antitoxin component of YhaV-PrlF toxin-antitoxin module
VVTVTEQIISPVVPPSVGRDTGWPHGVGRAAASSGPPLATMPEVPAVLSDVCYGMSRVDAAGRLCDRAISRSLGWHPGDRVTMTGTPAVVLAVRGSDGLITLPDRSCVVVPASLRRRCGLRPGDRVLLAAYPRLDRLAIYPLTTVHEVLARHLDTTPSRPDESMPTGPDRAPITPASARGGVPVVLRKFRADMPA